MARYLGYLCLLRFTLANLKLWVTWKRGPSCWIKIGPKVMYMIALTNYILLPIASIIFFVFNWS